MTKLSPMVVPDVGGKFAKVDVIKEAYSKLRISGLTVNPTPQDLELALTRLENMVAEWFSRNIVINYNFEETPDPNTETGVIRSFQEAMSSCLALRCATDFGKEIPQSLFIQATSSMSNLSGRVAMDRLNQVQYPTRQARGSGNTLRYNRWARFYRIWNPGPNNPAQKTMFIGDINDYIEHFDAYLKLNETIASYSIVTDPGLILVSDSNDNENVYYRIEASEPTGDNQTLSQLVTIIITSSDGRVETRQILFEIVPKIKQ
jgi:hypothetical protein